EPHRQCGGGKLLRSRRREENHSIERAIHERHRPRKAHGLRIIERRVPLWIARLTCDYRDAQGRADRPQEDPTTHDAKLRKRGNYPFVTFHSSTTPAANSNPVRVWVSPFSKLKKVTRPSG